MPRRLQTGLLWAGSLTGILVAITIGLNLLANASKPQLAQEVSSTIGMDVRIDGGIMLGLLFGPQIFLNDVYLSSNGFELATAERVKISLALLPMLRGNVQLQKIDLRRPIITLQHNADGLMGFGKSEQAMDSVSELDLDALTFSDATFRFTDEQTTSTYEATGCQLSSQHLQRSVVADDAWLAGISLSAALSCAQLSRNLLVLTKLQAQISIEDDYVIVEPMTMTVFGAEGSGSIQANFENNIPHYVGQFTAPRVQLDALFESLVIEAPAAGQVDVALNLALAGSTLTELRQSISGTFMLAGEDLTLFNADLDEQLDRFESTQNFSLTDAGALIFIGPIGLLATKSYDFANALEWSGGESKIVKLISRWQLSQGVAEAQDVALATLRHRIALTGKLNLTRNSFEDINLVLLDPDGCMYVQQEISGNFQNPEISPPDVIRALLGPVVNVLERGQELLTGSDCEVVYTGTVTASP